VKHWYRAYGLTFFSEYFIPGLLEIADPSSDPDVMFSYRDEPDWVRGARRLPRRPLRTLPAGQETADVALQLSAYGEQEYFEIVYSDGSEFLVDACATTIWGACPSPLVIEDLTTYLVGPVMGFILRRRNMTPLHASTVEIDGCAIALCGAGGSGKSTTAAALALRGAPVLCEDVSPMLEEGGNFSVLPGYPRVCLWPDAVKILLGSEESLPRITPTWEKCYLPLDGRRARFAVGPRPLSAVYFLEPRVNGSEAPRIDEIRPGEALMRLVQNTYMNMLLSRKQRAEEFDVLSRLAGSIAFRRVLPHSHGTKLGALCDLILEDASKLAGEQRSPASRL
jgi:hypothetical protein